MTDERESFVLGEQPDGTWRISATMFETLARRVEVLNRRVRKTGGPGLGVERVRDELEETERRDPISGATKRVVKRWTVVRVTGEVPTVEGWSFLARVEHHADLGNIIALAPGREGETLDDALRTAPPTCDHCGYSRIRKDTFLLRKDGATKRVGRSCLADFLRSGDADEALRLWSLLATIRGLLIGASEGGAGGGDAALSTTEYLAATCAAIRNFGWISRKKARESASNGRCVTATADAADRLCGKCPTEERAAQEWRDAQPTDDDYGEAALVIEWAGTLADRDHLDDYLHNLRVACSLGYVARRTAGIIASAVQARRREIEALRAVESPQAVVPDLGEVGKRYDFDLKVSYVRRFDGKFGVTTLVGYVDADGRRYKWFAAGAKDVGIGDVARGKATIKARDVFRGVRETVLTRCSFG